MEVHQGAGEKFPRACRERHHHALALANGTALIQGFYLGNLLATFHEDLSHPPQDAGLVTNAHPPPRTVLKRTPSAGDGPRSAYSLAPFGIEPRGSSVAGFDKGIRTSPVESSILRQSNAPNLYSEEVPIPCKSSCMFAALSIPSTHNVYSK